MVESKVSNRAHYENIDRLIPLVHIKKALAVGFPYLVGLIRRGELNVYDVGGRIVDRSQVDENTRGLRVLESEYEEFIERIRVK